jgi:hypothetical protein
VFPGDRAWPGTSNITFGAAETVAGHVVVAVGSSGQVSFLGCCGSTDVVGWYSLPQDPYLGLGYEPVLPTRLIDTRNGSVPGGSEGILRVPVAGVAGVPSDVGAVVVNLTGTEASTSTFLTAYPSGAARPGTSNLNLVPRESRADLATVPSGSTAPLPSSTTLGTSTSSSTWSLLRRHCRGRPHVPIGVLAEASL